MSGDDSASGGLNHLGYSLSRLFGLLENGMNSHIRRSAAEQISEFARLKCHDAAIIIDWLKTCLASNCWDTRIAASYCLDAVLYKILSSDGGVFTKNKGESAEDTGWFSEDASARIQIKIDDLHVNRPLLSIIEYDWKRPVGKQEAGLLGSGRFGDLKGGTVCETRRDRRSKGKSKDRDGIKEESDQIFSKQGITSVVGGLEVLCADLENETNPSNTDELVMQKPSADLQRATFDTEYVVTALIENAATIPKKPRLEEDQSHVVSHKIEDLYNWLLENLFHHRWEFRHGSLMGLKVFVKNCMTKTGQRGTNSDEILEDLCVRLLCLTLMDRFADYVSDEVVAPVRQASSQLLATCCAAISNESTAGDLLGVLGTLLTDISWDVRHGAVLSLKYMLASCEITKGKIGIHLSNLQRLFDDFDADVTSVAAKCFLAVIDEVVQYLGDELPQFAGRLEEMLRSFDEINTSTSVYELACRLIQHMPEDESIKLRILAHLYRSLHSSSIQVRLSVLRCIEMVIMGKERKITNVSMLSLLETALRQLMMQIMRENSRVVLNACEKSWREMVRSMEPEGVLQLCEKCATALIFPLLYPHRLNLCELVLLSSEMESNKSLVHGRKEFHGRNNVQPIFGGRHHDYITFDRRATAARCVGFLLAALPIAQVDISYQVDNKSKATTNTIHENSVDFIICSRLFAMANPISGQHRIGLCLTLIHWIKELNRQEKPLDGITDQLRERLVTHLSGNVLYEELALYMATMQRRATLIVSALDEQGLRPNSIDENGMYSLDDLSTICEAYKLMEERNSTITRASQQSINTNNDHTELIDVVAEALNDAIKLTIRDRDIFSVRTSCFVAVAEVSVGAISEKLNPIIKPLMESIRRETNRKIQEYAADGLAMLMERTLDRKLRPHHKLAKNLTAMIYAPDANFDFEAMQTDQEIIDDAAGRYLCNESTGIISLICDDEVSCQSDSDEGNDMDAAAEPPADDCYLLCEVGREPEIGRRGAMKVIEKLCERFKDKILSSIPEIRKQATYIVYELPSDGDNINLRNALTSIKFLEVLAEQVDRLPLLQLYDTTMVILCRYGLSDGRTLLRHACARTIAVLIGRLPERALYVIQEMLFPTRDVQRSLAFTQGIIEAVHRIVTRLGSGMISSAHALCVPLLKLTSHQDWYVRMLANRCFAVLVKLYPLHSKNKISSDAGQFLDRFLNPSQVRDYKLPPEIKINLRPYQREGVNWLFFLRDFNLNGILCDDMGLGKTLQTLCLLVGDHLEKKSKGEETRPNLVVCPTTVVYHWRSEIERFFSDIGLKVVIYCGTSLERDKLQQKFKLSSWVDCDVLITSYEVIRSDTTFFSDTQFSYVVLDEGHIIKKSKTKLSMAIKRVACSHRLILSGTPVQNNVAELWCLFNFLMPGYLGTEKQFNARFAKPLVYTKETKGYKDQESGAIALVALHKQVLPFMLRRMKHDVLSCLPPKVIQDYYCELTEIQAILYDDFCSSNEINSEDTSNTSRDGVFMALQYLRRLCNHPSLVCDAEHSQWPRIQKHEQSTGIAFKDYRHSGKLVALKELLVECGVGDDSLSLDDKHRLLIFCQLRSTLTVIKDLVLTELPGVCYETLDGAVPNAKRHEIVQRFNADKSIDLLLLTTHVGGLGLTLTGADVVIFVEHDWNPSKDMQAMDRAHRIGQTRKVNVYRLVTKGTLEEKIMSLQKFKTKLADSVITTDNCSTKSMKTSLAELFNSSSENFAAEPDSKSSHASLSSDEIMRWSSVNSLFETVETMWNASEYLPDDDLSRENKKKAK